MENLEISQLKTILIRRNGRGRYSVNSPGSRLWTNSSCIVCIIGIMYLFCLYRPVPYQIPFINFSMLYTVNLTTIIISINMKKKFKARKTKNIAEKINQANCYRFGVNPLIKQELLQLLKDTTKTPAEDVEENYPVWKNFEVPAEFVHALKQLAQHMDVYDNMMYVFDL